MTSSCQQKQKRVLLLFSPKCVVLLHSGKFSSTGSPIVFSKGPRSKLLKILSVAFFIKKAIKPFQTPFNGVVTSYLIL